MSKENWTKGSWEAFFCAIGCGEDLIATVAPRPVSNQSDDFDLDEGMANARLIAAAPELYEALKKVVEWFDAEDDHTKTTFHQRVEMAKAFVDGADWQMNEQAYNEGVIVYAAEQYIEREYGVDPKQ